MKWLAPHGRIVIAGGSGFLGLNLARHLTHLGCEVVILSRRASTTSDPWRTATWDARTLGDWKTELNGAAALVNLVGRPVDCIKTPDHCDEILRSRVEATRVLGEAVRAIDQPPPVWVQMSTAHIYGDPPEALCDEFSVTGHGLAPDVGRAWEAAYLESVLPVMRGVVLRTSFVLGKSGGAMRRLGPLARCGLGGTVSHGRQGMSWIHERDLNRLLTRAIADPCMTGTYVATAPHPVSNRHFMRALRQAVGMPLGLPAFAWAIRLVVPLILRTDPDLILYGRYSVSKRLADEGFTFEFETIEAALRDLYA